MSPIHPDNRVVAPNWPGQGTNKSLGKPKPCVNPKRVLITARIDYWIKQALHLEAIKHTAGRFGYQAIVNAALAYWMNPESYVCIIGTDDEGIVSVTHHATELLAQNTRLERRINWIRQVDGLWLGKVADVNSQNVRVGAWCDIRKVVLEKGGKYAPPKI